MSAPRLLVAVALLAALSLSGCGNPSAKLIGKWKMSGLSGSEDNPFAGLATKLFTVDFEFKADGSCVSNVEVLGKQQSSTGTWRFVRSEGSDLVVGVKFKSANEEREARVTFKDNDHCTFVPPNSSGGAGRAKVDFVRDK